MRRFLSIVGLEFYAVALAMMRFQQGLHTDEAKYLLNIPYPHPPLARFILSLTKELPHQELVWRIVFASLIVQAVWLVWYCTADRTLRRLLACLWLTSPAVVLQAGSVMMAPLTGLSGFIFLVAAVRSQRIKAEKDTYLGKRQAFFLGLFWLASLFTAFQAVLFLPLVIAAFLRSSIARWKATVYIVAPIIVLALYALTNPLAIASMGTAATENGSLTLLARGANAVMLLVLGGGMVFGLVGLAGILVSRRIELLVTFFLVMSYCVLSYHDYYAILLTPLLLFGVFLVLQKRSKSTVIILAAVGIFSSLSAIGFDLSRSSGVHAVFPRAVISQLQAVRPELFDATVPKRTLLIVGPFGHDWQYESPFEVHKYTEKLRRTQADVLVCLQACHDALKEGMLRIDQVQKAELYVR